MFVEGMITAGALGWEEEMDSGRVDIFSVVHGVRWVNSRTELEEFTLCI